MSSVGIATVGGGGIDYEMGCSRQQSLGDYTLHILVRLCNTESKMNPLANLASKLGCLLSVVLPLVGLVLYPRARWLFAFVIVGIAVLVLNGMFRKDPSHLDVANHAQGLLEGATGTWDVDDYEHLNPHEPRLHDLWRRTMAIGGLPEEWPQLDEGRANELRNIIREMRDLGRNRES